MYSICSCTFFFIISNAFWNVLHIHHSCYTTTIRETLWIQFGAKENAQRSKNNLVLKGIVQNGQAERHLFSKFVLIFLVVLDITCYPIFAKLELVIVPLAIRRNIMDKTLFEHRKTFSSYYHFI